MSMFENSWKCIHVRPGKNKGSWKGPAVMALQRGLRAGSQRRPWAEFHLHAWNLVVLCNVPRPTKQSEEKPNDTRSPPFRIQNAILTCILSFRALSVILELLHCLHVWTVLFRQTTHFHFMKFNFRNFNEVKAYVILSQLWQGWGVSSKDQS